MLEYFVSLNFPHKIIICIFLLIALILIGVFLRWFVLQLKDFFKDKNVSTDIFSISGKPVDSKKFCHGSCPNVKDIINLLHLQQTVITRIYHIKDKEILYTQMSFCENKVDTMITDAEKAFGDLMIENGNLNYYNSPEYIYYRTLLEDLREKALNRWRHMCKENHFLEKSEEDFRHYAQVNAKLIIDTLANQAKNYYPYRTIIPNFEKISKALYSKGYDYAFSVIQNGRKVSYDKNKEIQRLQEDFDNKYEDIIGEKPVMIHM